MFRCSVQRWKRRDAALRRLLQYFSQFLLLNELANYCQKSWSFIINFCYAKVRRPHEESHSLNHIGFVIITITCHQIVFGKAVQGLGLLLFVLSYTNEVADIDRPRECITKLSHCYINKNPVCIRQFKLNNIIINFNWRSNSKVVSHLKTSFLWNLDHWCKWLHQGL